jgi:hypothetical protein
VKSDAALAALPMRERVAWQSAELIAAHNAAVSRMLTAAVAAGRTERHSGPDKQKGPHATAGPS